MIFVDNINEEITLREYLYTNLLDNLKDKVDQVIQCFYFNLTNESRKLFAKIFFKKIYVYGFVPK